MKRMRRHYKMSMPKPKLGGRVRGVSLTRVAARKRSKRG